MRLRTRAVTLALVAGLAVVGVACGDDNGTTDPLDDVTTPGDDMGTETETE